MNKFPAIIHDKPHFTIICGRKGSGKTNLTVKLLRSVWKGIYDSVVVISPTFLLQQNVWSQIKPEGIRVYLQFRHDTIENLLTEQTQNRNKLLLLIDDVGEDVLRDVATRPLMHKLIANSRHLRTSIVWLAQKLTQIPTYARANTDVFINFASLSTRERQALYDEVSICSLPAFTKMFNESTKEPYSTFCASFQNGKLEYYVNLEKKIEVED